MNSSPFLLRSVTPFTAPAGFPPDVAPNQIIYASHINAIRDSVALWPGDVNGNAKILSNVGKVGIGTASAPASLTVRGTARVSPLANPAAYNLIETLTIGEESNNPDYRLRVGYWASPFAGALQTYVAALPGPLLLNPAGGSVGIGGIPSSTFFALQAYGNILIRLDAFDPAAIPNGGMAVFLAGAGGSGPLIFYVRGTDGVVRTASVALA